MKICPKCGSQYSDDTLQFCLQDGNPLGVLRQAETATVVLNETETVVRSPDRMHVPIGETETFSQKGSEVTRVAAAKGGSRIPLVLGAFALVLLFFVVAVGVGAYWMYTRNIRPDPANVQANDRVTNTNIGLNRTPSPSPGSSVVRSSPTPNVSPTITPNSPPPPPVVDTGPARAEVVGKVYSWKSMLESRDFNGYMANYADSVDYYKRRGVSSAAIRADKARAFQMYDSMQVNVSNETATVSADGNRATVAFDKEWHFSGRSRSDGKTRSQLEFTKVGGRWLITAERDLQLYYKR